MRPAESLMVGDFTTVNGFTRNRIARLATDGTLDLDSIRE